MFQFGIDRLCRHPDVLGDARLGLLTHPAALTEGLEPSWSALRGAGRSRLVRLFGPEHGVDGSAQDMAGVAAGVHPESGLPVVSLYGADLGSLAPSPQDLEGIDLLVCDLQDVGARYYTFVWTTCLAIDACARAGVAVVVCDRPNPLGGRREGEPQRPDFLSFVGLHPVPVRHGLTVGEIALLYARERGIAADLRVIPMSGWGRAEGWPGLRPWIPPSPNMPTLATARVYPGTCLLEATNLSEGRGTTRPFEQVGAPFVDARALADALAALALPGVRFRPAHFRPTFHKFAGQTCHGVYLHVMDPSVFAPFETGVRLIETVRRLWPRSFRWRAEPYEFETRPAVDLLTGSPEARERIEAGEDLAEYCQRQRRPPAFDGISLYPERRPVLVCVVGPHDAGKTTLVERLVPELRRRGLSVGGIKHTPHAVGDDVAGKDSFRIREAGAEPTAFVRTNETTVRHAGEADLDALVSAHFGPCDIVVAEGFKARAGLRIEVERRETHRVLFEGEDFADRLDALAEALLRRTRAGETPLEVRAR